MAQHIFENISHHYDELFKDYGYDHKTLEYGSRESQFRKFEILSSVCSLNGLSILDIGSGFADFHTYLGEHYEDITYEGFELSQAIIDFTLNKKKNLKLSNYNILDDDASQIATHDIVVSSGIFTLLGNNAPLLMQNIVKAMFRRCKVAVAFNSLSTWWRSDNSNIDDEIEYFADPILTLEWCRKITPWVSLRHDYMPHDFTIFLYKEQQL